MVQGRNYCILQVSPREALTEVPDIAPSTMAQDLNRLLTEADECDGITDTVCVVAGSVRFPAHSFILANGSEVLNKQLKFAETVNPTVLEFEEIQPQIFQQILKFLYTKSTDLLKEGPCMVQVPDASDASVETRNRRNEADQQFLDPADANLSAFAVYDKNKKKRLGKKIDSGPAEKKKASNPLVQLLEAGKMLGLYGLTKLVDCFR